jgi:beta-galactosidase
MPKPILSRRTFVGSAIAAATLPLVLQPKYAWSQGAFQAPGSPRQKYDFNLDWRFVREDVAGAEATAFSDSTWQPVSLPHSFNDVDSFRTLISHGGGDRGTYKGLSWYRKHFTLPKLSAGARVFLEFEGMRQAGDLYLNGKAVGLYENGVTAYGVDITKALAAGDNVLAVRVDNRTTYQERATSTTFEWNANDFNPDHGGINRHVWLHVTGPIFQTLPLFYGLESQGLYIHANNFNIAAKSADVTVEAEVRNGSGDRATVALSAFLVDQTGHIAAQFDAEPVDMVDGEKSVLMAQGAIKAARWWSVEDPYLYDVWTVLKVDGKVVDVERTVTGFRKTEFKGGVGKGGVYLNDQFLYLKGFAQRSSDEWAAIGAGYPDWLHDYQAQQIRACHGNHMRWMHVAPTRTDADALCRAGIVQVCPAGDKERDAVGVQWEQRLAVMRDTIISFRNNPSILFWEAGNTVVTPEHMTAMVALRKQWDPEGGRVMGARGNGDDAANKATTPIAEYYGVMIGQDARTDQLQGPADMFRAYSAERRDRAPLIETEDFRDEGARRFWDPQSPPYFGFKKGPNDTYEYTSESFALAGVKRYWDYWQNRISNTDPVHAKWSGYVSIYFSDEDADGRQDSSEVARVSGKVDAVRLPKEIYFAHRVMQSETPDLHILGHWSYPADRKTNKTIYVIANTQSVELVLNGKSLGVNSKPESGWIFAFPAIDYVPGTLKAIGTNATKPAASQELTTAGPAAALKLTPTVSPQGLMADGQDIAFFDIEVVDAKGQRCPTDDARVDFTCTGPAIWRGGYNSGKADSTNNLWLNTECGINRIFIRTRRAPGTITITAKRPGLKDASASVVSKAVMLEGGLRGF